MANKISTYRKGDEITQIKIWKREPFVVSITFSHARGIYPIANQSPFKKKYDEAIFDLAISSKEIKALLKLFHEAGAQYFEIYKDTVHIWVDSKQLAVGELIRKVWPEEIIYFAPSRNHRRYKLRIRRWNSKKILVEFPRAERAGFYPASDFFGFVILSSLDFRLKNVVVRKFIELLLREGMKVGPRQTKMWIYGEIEPTAVRNLLYKVYPQEWLDVQVN